MADWNKIGFVSLVGAGPGDPGLITMLGAECLARADVVIFDRLVNPMLLRLASQAEMIPVGKHAGHHPVPHRGNDEKAGRTKDGFPELSTHQRHDPPNP